jgi:hypothetical protein
MTGAPAHARHDPGTVPGGPLRASLRDRARPGPSRADKTRGQSPGPVLVGLVVLAISAVVVVPPAAAREKTTGVVAVPGLRLDAIDDVAPEGAVGLVVPDAGPTTSEARALASLARGVVVNSLREEPPSGPALVDVQVVRTRWFAVVASTRGGVLIGVPRGGVQRNDRRYALVLYGRGHGVLTSDSTRIPGLVSIADVAHGRLRVEPAEDPVAELRELDARIRDNGAARAIAGPLVALLVAGLALRRPRAAVLAFGTAAAANLLLGLAGVSEPWLTVPALAVGTLAAVPLGRTLRPPTALGLALAGLLAAYLVAMGLDASSVALSPLGPTQNARFYGLSNLLETLLLVPALAAAALLARRYGVRGFVAAAALALVTVAGSRFGADGGGAIVLAVGFAVLGVALAGGGRRALALGLAGAAAAVALLAADALIGPTTHVGESLRGGPDELARDIADRVELSWDRATAGWGVGLAIAAALIALAVLVARGSRRPFPLPLAVAAAIGASLLVNDSPKEVAVGGLVSYLVAERLTRDGQEGSGGYTPVVPSRS